MSFDLHRPEGGRADWENTPPEQWNRFQRLAAMTHGVATPANVLDIGAMCLLEDGLQDFKRGEHVTGGLKLLGSIAEDAINGLVADRTGTKSPFGEFVDVATDVHKSARLSTLVNDGFIPVWVAGAITVRKAANIGAIAVAKRRGVPIHTTKEGKLAEAAQNVMIFSAISSRVADLHKKEGAKKAATALLVASTLTFTKLSVYSTVDYWRMALRNKP